MPNASTAEIDEIAKVAEAAEAEYRDKHLGLFSSHPYWLERGERVSRWLVVGSLCVLYLLVTYVWLRGSSLPGLLQRFAEWGGGAGGAIALALVMFAVGMLFGGSFAARWAIARSLDSDLAPGNHRGLGPVNPVIATLIAAAGFILPIVLTFGTWFPPELRLLGPVIALLPAATLCYLLPARRYQRFSFPWVTVGLLAILLLTLPAYAQVARWLAETLGPWFKPTLPELAEAGGWSGLIALILLGLSLLAFFRIALWYLFGRQPKQPVSVKPVQPESTVDPLDWARRLAGQHGLSPDALKWIQTDPRETVDWQQDSEFLDYFDGRVPTQDQHRVLRDFLYLADTALGPGQAGDASCGFDMLVEGPLGSGRSTTLDAIAMVSLLELGQRVVLMVPDEARVELTLKRIDGKIARLGLHPFILAGRLDPAWIQLDASPPPDIVVTTAENWEQQLPGIMTPGNAERDRVCRVMRLYSTVLVDDWTEHPMPVRLHLPFIIDKHRLLLEAALVPSARLFCFGRLSETGRGLVIDRLFGHGGITNPARQVARLRYRRELAAWSLDIAADKVNEAIDQIAEFLSTNAGQTVLIRSGIDEQEAARQTEEYRTRFVGAGITVCYCHDQVDGVVGELSSVVMRAAEGPDAVFAIRSRRSDEHLVIIRVRGVAEIESLRESTPLIIDRSGRGMAEAHLANILRFIDSRVPVAHRAWGQLGVSWNHVSALRTDGPPRPEIGRLLLDRPEGIPEAVRASRPYLQSLGAFVALDKEYRHFSTVDPNWIGEPQTPPWLVGSDRKFGTIAVGLPEPIDGGLHRGNTLTWKGNDGAALGRSQLQYADRLILHRRQVFCIASRRPDATGGLEALAARFRANGRDPVNPKFEVSWSLAPSADQSPPIELMTGFGGPMHGFMWTEQRHSGLGHRVSSTLLELCDDAGRPSHPGRFDFSYEAALRLLLLAPSAAIFERPDRFEAALRQWLSSELTWGTSNHGFLPGLTLALGRSIDHALPGSAFLGKFLVFRLDGEMARFARAIVWFVEPLGTGSTLSNAVYELFKADGAFVTLVGRMQQMLSGNWAGIWLEDRARFWLAHSKLPEVSEFERSLLVEMLGQANGGAVTQPPAEDGESLGPDRSDESFPVDEPGGDLDKTGSKAYEFRFRCPHCRATWTQAIEYRHQSHTIAHCGQPVAMLVPGQGDLFTTPRTLLAPWWPPGRDRPDGPIESQIRAVWALIAQRVEYVRDHHQFDGRTELWATPEWVWAQGRGDCEDHSTLMVAMLRALGRRSWLVWGMHGAEGHAWVQAEVDGSEILIEATLKGELPDRLPTLSEAAILSGGSYFPEAEGPARTDGETYDAWDGSRWLPVLMIDPEVMSSEHIA